METLINIAQFAGVFLLVTLAVRFVANVLNENRTAAKQVKPDYKQISVMAANLVQCKVSTRTKVLKELYEDPDWEKADVDELKSVIEGMLNTKIFVDDDDDEKGLKSI